MAFKASRIGVVIALLGMTSALVVIPHAHAQRSANERRADAPVAELLRRRLEAPTVAWSHGEYLVAWVERRLGGPGSALEVNQILGARVTQDGRVLDPRGFFIAAAAGRRREVRVADSGEGFVVLWTEQAAGPFAAERPRWAHVGLDGDVSVPASEDGSGDTTPPGTMEALGCNDRGCVATSAFGPLRALAFDVCAGLRAELELVVPPRTSSQSGRTASAARVASDPCGHLLAFGQHDERSGEMSIAVAALDQDGALRASPMIIHNLPAGSHLPSPDVASNRRGEALAVWQQPSGPPPATIVPPFEEQGEVWSLRLDSLGAAVSEPARLARSSAAALAFDGERYVMVTGLYALQAFMLSNEGNLLSSDPVVVRDAPAGLRGPARVAAGPEGALVVWQPTYPLEEEINAARLDRGGELMDPDGLALAHSANRQWAPRLASDGESYLLLFHDDRPDRAGVLALQLDPDGGSLGQSAPVLPVTLDDRVLPELHAAGDRYAVMWSELDAGSFIAWIDAGARNASAPVALAVPEIESGGLRGAYFTPGRDAVLALGLHPGQLCGEDQACDTVLSIHLLNADGSPRSSVPVAVYGPDGAWARDSPVAAYDGSGFAVAWSQRQVGLVEQGSSDGVRVVYVSPDGTARTEPLAVTSSSPEGRERPVALMHGADGFLLVVSRTLGAALLYEELFALRLSADLSPRDPEPIALATGERVRGDVRVAHDGVDFVVVWEEHATGASRDIYGARVPEAGELTPARFGIAVSPLDEVSPTVAAAGAGHVLVAYERLDTDPAAMSGRVFVRDVLSASCDEPLCCDGECRGAGAQSCDSAPAQPADCDADAGAVTPKRGTACGCRTLGRGRGSGRLPFAALLLLLLWRLRRA